MIFDIVHSEMSTAVKVIIISIVIIFVCERTAPEIYSCSKTTLHAEPCISKPTSRI